MTRQFILTVVGSLILTSTCAAEEKAAAKNPVIVMQTSHGAVTIELFADKAQITVKNFLKYTDDKFYDGTIFHRVISTFMIQGGGFKPGMEKKKTRATIKNESSNGLSNKRGTIAMARTPAPDSASSQFFINVKDNEFLNHRPGNFGYAVFGRVVGGMDVVKKIEAVPTTSRPGHQNVPETPVVIESARRK